MGIQTKIIVALLALIGMAGGLWIAHRDGVKVGRAEHALEDQAADAQLAREALATHTKQTETIIGAVNARTQTTQRLAADHAAADLERGRLRATLASAAQGIKLPNASADSCTAKDELLGTMAAGIDRLAQTGGRIAEEADQHAADSLMYQTGWLKPP